MIQIETLELLTESSFHKGKHDLIIKNLQKHILSLDDIFPILKHNVCYNWNHTYGEVDLFALRELDHYVYAWEVKSYDNVKNRKKAISQLIRFQKFIRDTTSLTNVNTYYVHGFPKNNNYAIEYIHL